MIGVLGSLQLPEDLDDHAGPRLVHAELDDEEPEHIENPLVRLADLVLLQELLHLWVPALALERPPQHGGCRRLALQAGARRHSRRVLESLLAPLPDHFRDSFSPCGLYRLRGALEALLPRLLVLFLELRLLANLALERRPRAQLFEDLLLHRERLDRRLLELIDVGEVGGVAVLHSVLEVAERGDELARDVGELEVVGEQVDHRDVRAVHLAVHLLEGHRQQVDVEAHLEHADVVLDLGRVRVRVRVGVGVRVGVRVRVSYHDVVLDGEGGERREEALLLVRVLREP